MNRWQASAFVASCAATAVALGTVACGTSGPFGRNLVVPTGSVYVAPAEQVQALGYRITHVDTIIGYIEAYRFRGGTERRADRLVVDVYAVPSSGRRVLSVAAQSLEQTGPGGGLSGVTGIPTTPSPEVRRDAARLLTNLGCENVESEQRMGENGIEFATWCAENGTDEQSQ